MRQTSKLILRPRAARELRSQRARTARLRGSGGAPHEHEDLRMQGSVVRALRGYADGAGRCSNRKALPDCVTSQPRQLTRDQGWRLWTNAQAAPTQSLGIFMRMSNSPQKPIFSPPLLPTAISAGVENLECAALPPLSSRRVGPNRAPLIGRP